MRPMSDSIKSAIDTNLMYVQHAFILSTDNFGTTLGI